MEDTQVQDPPVAVAGVAPADPFSLDENSLVSLSPEQRGAVEPIINVWRVKANEEISKREAAATERYKPMEERAAALDKLTKYQPFVQWWNQQQSAAQQQNPGQAGAISQAKPDSYASPQEWSDAVLEASNGDATKLQNIQARMMATWATPLVKQLTEKQQVLETQMNLKDLFESHPDAKALDQIGLDPKTKDGVSLLEQALDWAERNGRTMEDGYNLARKWADQFKVASQQEAMGLVNSKRSEVTAGPSTASASTNVITVDNVDELMKRSLDAQLSGNKDVRFVIRGK